jgi:amidase
MLPNTAPFDVSGNPALSVPCGLSDGLPVGMMFVGKNWDEETVLRAAHTSSRRGRTSPSPSQRRAVEVEELRIISSPLNRLPFQTLTGQTISVKHLQ